MYSILEADGKEKRKAKGINKSARDKELRHELYVRSLMDEQTTDVTMRQIRSHGHEVFTEQITKLALSPFDDKRYVLDDKCTTLALGHCRVRQAAAAAGGDSFTSPADSLPSPPVGQRESPPRPDASILRSLLI
jgi:hypothetical protein